LAQDKGFTLKAQYEESEKLGLQNKKEFDVHNENKITDDEIRYLLSCTYYEILGCGIQGFGTTLDEIKKGYQKTLLKYHPGKTGRGETDPVFLKVQAAFNTLSDTTKRRAYDSQNVPVFHDIIPNGKETFKTEEEFYKLYGEAFARNARFSETLPTPAFGGAELTGKALSAMYVFWGAFKSWRSFDKMMKENEGEAEKAKMKESIRLTKMVDLAKKFDPRLKREREKEKKEADEKKQIEDEKATLIKNALKNAAKKKKTIRDKQKKALRKSKAQFRKISAELLSKCRAVDTSILKVQGNGDKLFSEIDVSELCDRCNSMVQRGLMGRLADMCDRCQGGTESVMMKEVWEVSKEVMAVLMEIQSPEYVRKLQNDEEAFQRQQNKLVDAAKKATSKESDKHAWTDEEKAELSKACSKFPGGSLNRWQAIADYLSAQLLLENPLTKEECFEMSNKMVQNHHEQQKKIIDGTNDSSELAAKEEEVPADGWTKVQQAAFQKALTKFGPKMKKSARWKAVGDAVPGKTKKECEERFKFLRAAGKGKKYSKNQKLVTKSWHLFISLCLSLSLPYLF
jgi:DnaJ family protein C protein 2